MAIALTKKAADVVNAKMCSVSHDLHDLKSALAKGHPVMVAISKDKTNENWVQLVRDLVDRALAANAEALDWNNAIRTDLQS